MTTISKNDPAPAKASAIRTALIAAALVLLVLIAVGVAANLAYSAGKDAVDCGGGGFGVPGGN